jgi:hypothetical protein
LAWQLGALTLEPALSAAAELVVGNLDEGRDLATSEEELAGVFGQMVDQLTPNDRSLRRASGKGRGAEYRQGFWN